MLTKCKLALICFAISASHAVLADKNELPAHYAYGAEITVPDEAIFSRLLLDKPVYVQSLSPELDDVRIFNRYGHPVPFALTPSYTAQPDAPPRELHLYPLETPAVAADNETRLANDYNYHITVNGSTVNINTNAIARDSQQSDYAARYLLTLPEPVSASDAPTRYQLSFADHADNWQGSASIYTSQDLKNWHALVREQPLMQIRNPQGQQIVLDTITSRHAADITRPLYWLVTLHAQTPLPALTSVTLAATPSPQKAQLGLDFTLTAHSDSHAEYRLASAQPLNSLLIRLAQNRSVQPVAIYSKANDADQWHKLADRVLYQDDATQTGETFAIEAGRGLVQAIKLEAMNSRWQAPPTLTGFRHQVALVFNSANNGPFVLAWGNPHASRVALPLAQLLPTAITPAMIPEVVIGHAITLGGEAVLSQTVPSESRFPQWIVWLALFAGAGLLGWLAYRLSREIKTSS